MVPPEIILEIRQGYDAVSHQSLDPNKYEGVLFDVVCEVITAETFIAGIASKILDDSPIDPTERLVVHKAFLVEGRWWLRDNGQPFDTRECAEVHRYALCIEGLRRKCHAALSRA